MPFHPVTLKADDKFVSGAITHYPDSMTGIEAIDWFDLFFRNTLFESSNDFLLHATIGDRRFTQDFPAMKTVAVAVRPIGI